MKIQKSDQSIEFDNLESWMYAIQFLITEGMAFKAYQEEGFFYIYTYNY